MFKSGCAAPAAADGVVWARQQEQNAASVRVSQRASELAPEHAARRQVDVEVARVV